LTIDWNFAKFSPSFGRGPVAPITEPILQNVGRSLLGELAKH